MSEETIDNDEEEKMYDEASDRAEVTQEVAEEYGSPEPEEKLNQFKIIKDAIESRDNVKTTFLTRPELGKPLFSARFYMDCKSIAKMYRAPLIEKYFNNKVQNLASSGMSNEGFVMKLNVTNRRDVTRKSERKLNNEEEKSP